MPTIIYDPFWPRDALHVAHLRKMKPVTSAIFPFAGHKILRTLKQVGILKSTQSSLLLENSDFNALVMKYRKTRRISEDARTNEALFLVQKDRHTRLAALLDKFPELRSIVAAYSSSQTSIMETSSP